jgi:hypothetical protein
MADDKTIVTKKTTPKAAATTKTAVTKKTASKAGPAAPSAAKKAPTASAAAGKASPAKPSAIAAKAAPAKAASAASTGKTPAASTRSKKPAAKTSSAAAHGGLQGKKISLRSLANVSPAERLHMVHEAAYYRAEKRGFEPGHEVEDWAEAEREIDELIANAKRISGH